MKFQQHQWITRLKTKESLSFIGILAIVTWTAHFWHFGGLGLYEDDYFYVGEPIRMNLLEFFDFIKRINLYFFQGRIVGFNIVLLSAFIGGHLGGLKLVYAIAYLWVLTNNILFYIFLKRLWDQPFFVICGTLSFALFPADNTRAFLTHIHVLPSVTFILIAFLCYFSQKRIISYLFILAALLSYETCFPLFLAAPLFKNKWNGKLLKEFIRNALVLGFIFLGVLMLRKLTGDSRVNDLDILTAVLTPLRQTLIGPFISLSTFFSRPWQVLVNLKGELLFLLPITFALLTWFLLQLKVNRIDATTVSTSEMPFGKNSENSFSIRQLVLVSLILLFLAYPLTFTVHATQISGRDSRVHTAAVLGASLLAGIVCHLIVCLAATYRQKNLAATILAAYFTLLVGFGLIVQHDNQRCWQYQQAFWTDVTRLAPDITEGTVILVDAPSMSWGRQLHPIHGLMQYVLGQIYQFPQDWEFIPKLYRLNPNWQNKIDDQGILTLDSNNGVVYFYFHPWELDRHLQTSEIILLQEKNGKLIRQTDPIIVGDKKFYFKPISKTTLDIFKKGFLYKDIINPSIRKSIDYLKVMVILPHLS